MAQGERDSGGRGYRDRSRVNLHLQLLRPQCGRGRGGGQDRGDEVLKEELVLKEKHK